MGPPFIVSFNRVEKPGGMNLRPLVYKASDLTASQELCIHINIFVAINFKVSSHKHKIGLVCFFDTMLYIVNYGDGQLS